MNIVPLSTGTRLPADAAIHLREILAAVERGEVTQMVVGYVQNDEYCFLWPSSITNSIVLTSMMHKLAVEKVFT